MYTVKNFKTKKALKQAITDGEQVHVYQPGPSGRGIETGSQDVFLEGPHYPKPHRWYASGRIVDGLLVTVK